MKYWIIADRQQTGPFDEADLENLQFDETTPMWHEGLPDWVPAAQIDAARAILERRRAPQPQPDNVYQTESETVITEDKQPEVYKVEIDPQPETVRPMQPTADGRRKPDNYLAWAIISTILCCVPLGAVAIYFAAQVNTRFTAGDFDGAEKASERAQLWIILAIVLGLITTPFEIMLKML